MSLNRYWHWVGAWGRRRRIVSSTVRFQKLTAPLTLLIQAISASVYEPASEGCLVIACAFFARQLRGSASFIHNSGVRPLSKTWQNERHFRKLDIFAHSAPIWRLSVFSYYSVFFPFSQMPTPSSPRKEALTGYRGSVLHFLGDPTSKAYACILQWDVMLSSTGDLHCGHGSGSCSCDALSPSIRVSRHWRWIRCLWNVRWSTLSESRLFETNNPRAPSTPVIYTSKYHG